MSDFIYSRVSMFGDSIEIMTPKHVDDAQHRHTIAYFEAFNELRRREADRVQKFNSYVADKLREPRKIYSRENPGGLLVGSKYTKDERVWRPALPLVHWSPPKPLTDKQARAKADVVIKNAASGKYVPKSWYFQGQHNEAFKNVTFEESES